MNPVYGREEIDSVCEYMNMSGWVMEHSLTRKMEQMICEYTGARYAHMVPSATSGLLIASIVANITNGTKFAVPAYTQAATANGAISLGGVPSIVDVDMDSFVIDFDLIPSDCEVVFVTSINGRYSDSTLDNIKKLRHRGIFVIEDSAQSLGSWSNNCHIGTNGDMGVFSFGAPKIITTGQGGCIVTDNREISDKIKAIKNFGRTVGTGETYNTFGLNFKFTDLQAAFGIEQMKKLPMIVERKRSIFKEYMAFLSDVGEFITTDLDKTTPTYPEILINDRKNLIEYLARHDVGTREVYSSLAIQPFHRKWATSPTPNTDYISSRGLQLPSQYNLDTRDILTISNYIREFFGMDRLRVM